ncbi:PP2C family protein-serine/threonine phosphatase [Streptomyces sp. NPDC058619]|uniref:PP2C family protein-serine/threonine phosphatase n=1 Tax=unclassified Streptomyces TaxID=2593676 RepID=UPI0036607170
MDRHSDMLEMLTRILDDGHLCSFDQLPGLVAGHAGRAGMDNVRIFLADLREQVLREATGRGIDAAEGGETLLIEGTLPGRVFTTIRPLPGPEATPRRWWVPILDGTERIGVLGADLADGVETEQLNTLASLVGLLVVGKRPHSDAHPRLVRTEAMNLAAELQWNLMPPRSFANSNVVVAAAMEPAYEVGGDAFDYAIAGDQVHLGIFDAMGHDSHAGLAANVAVTACRNQRRQDTDLVTTSERIEESLIEHFGHNTYVTAVLGDVNADTGLFSWINRGHHPPILIRAGRWTTALSCPPAHPLGTDLGLPITLRREQLEPGDRILLYTDGITEARDRNGRPFGMDQFTDFVIRHHANGLPVAETLRRLMRAVMDHHDGRLADDATVLCLEWHGPSRNKQLRPTGPEHTRVETAVSRTPN